MKNYRAQFHFDNPKQLEILTQEKERQILELYTEYKGQEIARMLKLSYYQIKQVLDKYNIQIKKRGGSTRNITPQEEKQIINLYKHYNIITLANMFKVHTKTIKNILLKHNIKIKPAGSPNKIFTTKEEKHIIYLYTKKNYGLAELEKMFKTTILNIKKLLIKYNLPIRTISSPRRNSGRKFSQYEIQKIIKLYKNYGAEAVKKEINSSWETIKKILIANNISIKKSDGQKYYPIKTKKDHRERAEETNYYEDYSDELKDYEKMYEKEKRIKGNPNKKYSAQFFFDNPIKTNKQIAQLIKKHGLMWYDIGDSDKVKGPLKNVILKNKTIEIFYLPNTAIFKKTKAIVKKIELPKNPNTHWIIIHTSFNKMLDDNKPRK